MSNETLGARLRNLLSPYKNLIEMNKNGMDVSKYLEANEMNLKDLIDFSESDEMENIFLK